MGPDRGAGRAAALASGRVTASHESAERRRLIDTATVGGPGIEFGPPVREDDGVQTFRLTILGTTDLHGHALDWDYFDAAPTTEPGRSNIGLARAATLINAVRAERGASTCVTLDAGDTIQGTPLVHDHAGGVHPMAAAMNAVGFDAATLGNHEFNFGLPALRTFQSQLAHPLLGANAETWDDATPAFDPWVVLEVPVPGHEPVRVGVLGLVTPGVAEWDRPRVEGRVRFVGLVEQAARYVPELRAQADVVVVVAHSGTATGSTYPDDAAPLENASTLVAEQVPGIDVMLVGHAHEEIVGRVVVNEASGRGVLVTEPLFWGMRVAVIDVVLGAEGGRWVVRDASATMLAATGVEEDEGVLAAVRPAHDAVVAGLDRVIARTTGELTTSGGRTGATAVTGLITAAQASALASALMGTPFESLPVLSATPPVAREVTLPAGEVTARQVASLCPDGQTLIGVAVTGAQLAAYLEAAARFADGGGDPRLFDVVAPLTYGIDLRRPEGDRVRDLSYGGVPVTEDQQFVLAISNHRQAGEGGYPVAELPVVAHVQVDVRHLVIEWVQGVAGGGLSRSPGPGVLDVAALRRPGRRLVPPEVAPPRFPS